MSSSIGEGRGRARQLLREHGLTPFRKVLPPGLFHACANRLPAANALLIPEVVFWLMATVALQAGGTMVQAVGAFWQSLRSALPWLPPRPVTEEAFCLARKKLSLRFFVRLFHAVLDRFDAACANRYRWHGLRLLGIDGMDLALPAHRALRKVFPSRKGGKGTSKRPAAVLVGLVGLWDGLCRGFHLVPTKTSEQHCARRLTRHLGPSDLLLGDRNFPSYRLFCALAQRLTNFLFRLPANRYQKRARLATPSRHPDEWYLDVTRPRKLPKRLGLPDTIRLRVLRYQCPGFRTAYLITSLLDTEAFPYDELVALYHERWRQETFHREWKYSLSVGNLRSLSRQGLVKEVFVQLILNNVIRWIMTEATEPPQRPVDLSFLQAKRCILNHVPVMALAPTHRLPDLYDILLDEIASYVILVRPGRSYPRRHDRRPRNKGHGEIALPARLLPTETEKRNADI